MVGMFKPWMSYAKKDICRNPDFSMVLVSELSPFIVIAYDIFRFSTKNKMKT